MKTEFLSPEEAWEKSASLSDGTPRFPWAMVQTYSHMTLGRNPLTSREKLPEEWETLLQDAQLFFPSLLEARFFSNSEELRVFREEDGNSGGGRELTAVLTTEEAEDRYLEETTEIANKDQFGDSVTVRRMIGFDDDGQAWISMTRLSGWKGGAET